MGAVVAAMPWTRLCAVEAFEYDFGGGGVEVERAGKSTISGCVIVGGGRGGGICNSPKSAS